MTRMHVRCTFLSQHTFIREAPIHHVPSPEPESSASCCVTHCICTVHSSEHTFIRESSIHHVPSSEPESSAAYYQLGGILLGTRTRRSQCMREAAHEMVRIARMRACVCVCVHERLCGQGSRTDRRPDIRQ